ncbi:glyoxylase I family protein [Marchantia polymorpha subsp. ruderalis]|uniref:VOC domain-containing protein n=2 Tax=Marchantia polymorpha TaxID=3197 RepID=A0AAF6B9P9_MARPO|nr:hypothetical protein MARPO_0070s0082 [Marchantia polymorpha]BBN08733.1 hypothetical protein Mp_4g13990 [Marchantia polymorpha subsp. ruderalis]|eukprot:PTQ35620.1 hypothetical protein MARPO_0070s0082 [Marchantia polymorpha]
MALVTIASTVLSSSPYSNSPFTKLACTNKFSRSSITLSSVKRQQTRLQCTATSSPQLGKETTAAQTATSCDEKLDFAGMHHVGLLCENLERSLEFYQGILGLELNPDRPADKLPYRGAWFWVGAEMIHLMELPNPDPITGRPEHGGRDRHACVAIKSVEPLKRAFEKAGISFTLSKSGRPAIFARDPDGNALEFTQVG